jgi:hypothetical protein
MNPIFEKFRLSRTLAKTLLLAGMAVAVMAGSGQSSSAQCCSWLWGSCYQPTCCYQPSCCPSPCCSSCSAPACGSPCGGCGSYGVGGYGTGSCGGGGGSSCGGGVSYLVGPGTGIVMRPSRPQASVVTRWAPSQMVQNRIPTNTTLRANNRTTGAAASLFPSPSGRVVRRNLTSGESRLARTSFELRTSMNDVIARY